MTMDDVIFQIRRDTPKLNRLKEYLSWREIRKGLKTQTEKPTDDPSAAVDVKGTVRTASRYGCAFAFHHLRLVILFWLLITR